MYNNKPKGNSNTFSLLYLFICLKKKKITVEVTVRELSQDQAVAARPQSAKGQSRHVLLNGPRLLKFQTSTNIHEPFRQAPRTAATWGNVAVVPWMRDEKFHSSIL